MPDGASGVGGWVGRWEGLGVGLMIQDSRWVRERRGCMCICTVGGVR